MSIKPIHGQQRGYRILPGSMGAPGLHSEHEQYCGNCERWVDIVGGDGMLYWYMMHENKECIAPIPDDYEIPKWLKKKFDE